MKVWNIKSYTVKLTIITRVKVSHSVCGSVLVPVNSSIKDLASIGTTRTEGRVSGPWEGAGMQLASTEEESA